MDDIVTKNVESKIGRWGEEETCCFLSDNPFIKKFIWLNEEAESGRFPDFVGWNDKGQRIAIETKTSMKHLRFNSVIESRYIALPYRQVENYLNDIDDESNGFYDFWLIGVCPLDGAIFYWDYKSVREQFTFATKYSWQHRIRFPSVLFPTDRCSDYEYLRREQIKAAYRILEIEERQFVIDFGPGEDLDNA